MATAIYPGSFDPFTNGHLDIIKKASKLFDHITIVIAVNYDKKRHYDTDNMCAAIEVALEKEGITNCTVGYYEGIIVELMKKWKVNYIIRGLRDSTDFSYEEKLALVNTTLYPEVEYVYFRADNAAISSSMVRELVKHKVPEVKNFVPPSVFRLLGG